jgi:glucose/arabinose dehydrogenase
MRTTFITLLLLLAIPAGELPAQGASTPQPTTPNVHIILFAYAEEGAVRLAHDPLSPTKDLYFMKMNGEIKRIDNTGNPVLAYSTADHGIATTVGMAFGPDGTLYLMGNEVQGNYNVVTVRRGVLKPGSRYERTWSTVAHTAPYPRSNTNFDHNFNAIIVSLDGRHLFLNSGSRTDHGEVESNNGAFPGLREVPLTSAIFRIPANANDILLPNDEAALRAGGYLYADGTRNAYDMAFTSDGMLYATDNSGDHDDNDEINWIQEGHHYGFPWRMGTSDNPQRFPGYDPEADLLINHTSYAYTHGAFHNDPTFPLPPEGVTFTDPIMSRGPDGARYRDPITGSIRNDVAVGTLTPHRSPLGLAILRGDFEYMFVLSWNSGSPGSGSLLVPFDDQGEDLLLLKSFREPTARADYFVTGFNAPIDAELIGPYDLYVLDYGGDHAIWRIAHDLVVIEGVDADPSTPLSFTDCFPNPFSTTTSFSLSMARRGKVRLDLVNMMGERVASLFDGTLPEGRSPAFTVDGAGLPNGVYAIRAQGAGFSIVRRVVLLR